jgi:hypothetical protein
MTDQTHALLVRIADALERMAPPAPRRSIGAPIPPMSGWGRPRAQWIAWKRPSWP